MGGSAGLGHDDWIEFIMNGLEHSLLFQLHLLFTARKAVSFIHLFRNVSRMFSSRCLQNIIILGISGLSPNAAFILNMMAAQDMFFPYLLLCIQKVLMLSSAVGCFHFVSLVKIFAATID